MTVLVTGAMLAVIAVLAALAWHYGDPPEARHRRVRRGSLTRHHRRLRRPPLPRRPDRLTPGDRQTLHWIRSLGYHPTWTAAKLAVHITTLNAVRTWAHHETAGRIAALDLRPTTHSGSGERPWEDDTGAFTVWDAKQEALYQAAKLTLEEG
jgi:hypothetical protein